jgi:hypothetical protein
VYTHRPWLHEEADQARAEDRQTGALVAFAVILVLLIVGLFLVHQLHRATSIEDCLLAGHRNCDSMVADDR